MPRRKHSFRSPPRLSWGAPAEPPSPSTCRSSRRSGKPLPEEVHGSSEQSLLAVASRLAAGGRPPGDVLREVHDPAPGTAWERPGRPPGRPWLFRPAATQPKVEGGMPALQGFSADRAAGRSMRPGNAGAFSYSNSSSSSLFLSGPSTVQTASTTISKSRSFVVPTVALALPQLTLLARDAVTLSRAQ